MRIGLIAMSGVRVVNPSLIALGVTLPQFVNRGKVIAQLPSLALLLLAAQTPEDVEVDYIEVADLKAFDQLRTDYDMVAITSYTAMAYEMYDLADRYRAAGVPVVIGGLHASFAWEEAKQHADSVCIGEGEMIWPEIVADFRSGGKSALKAYYREKEPGAYDLANSPMPRYDLLLNRPYNRITVPDRARLSARLRVLRRFQALRTKVSPKAPGKGGGRTATYQRALGRQCVLRVGRR